LSVVEKNTEKWGESPRLEVWREAEGFVVCYGDRTSESLRTREDLYRVVDVFYQENQ
jgi:hypothetical protein